MNNVYENFIEMIKKYQEGITPDMEITPECRLVDLGVNSLTFIKLIVEVEKEYNIEFNEGDLYFDKSSTIKDFSDYVREHYIKDIKI